MCDSNENIDIVCLQNGINLSHLSRQIEIKITQDIKSATPNIRTEYFIIFVHMFSTVLYNLNEISKYSHFINSKCHKSV